MVCITNACSLALNVCAVPAWAARMLKVVNVRTRRRRRFKLILYAHRAEEVRFSECESLWMRRHRCVYQEADGQQRWLPARIKHDVCSVLMPKDFNQSWSETRFLTEQSVSCRCWMYRTSHLNAEPGGHFVLSRLHGRPGPHNSRFIQLSLLLATDVWRHQSVHTHVAPP